MAEEEEGGEEGEEEEEGFICYQTRTRRLQTNEVRPKRIR
jgi:hypothetical protein